MKIIKNTAIVALALLFFSACSTQPAKESSTNAVQADSTKVDTTALYECPMKCEGSKSDKPGKCPSCEMDLEKIQK